MTLIRTHRTTEGAALGKEHVRFYERALSDRPRELDGRCSTCAFRPGTIANGSPTTQMDVVKCIAEHVDFHCHEKGREGTLCHGFKILQAKPGRPPCKMPWPFSDEIP